MSHLTGRILERFFYLDVVFLFLSALVGLQRLERDECVMDEAKCLEVASRGGLSVRESVFHL